MTFSLFPRRAAQCYTVIQRHIVTNLCRLAYHHAHAVIDKEAPPYRGAGVDFDTGQGAANISEETRQPFEFYFP